jgi:hypothetical protein
MGGMWEGEVLEEVAREVVTLVRESVVLNYLVSLLLIDFLLCGLCKTVRG